MKKQRKHYTPEEKVAILRRHLLEADIEIILQGVKEKYPDARPRIISDNGPQFIAKDFKEFIRISGMTHVRTSPFYPQSNGKIERWHKSLKGDCIRPGTPLSLDDARRLVQGYVDHYNNVRLNSAGSLESLADALGSLYDKPTSRQVGDAGERPGGKPILSACTSEWPVNGSLSTFQSGRLVSERAQMALSPGTRLGPYEVLSPLGAGGMGEVYKARDTRLNRTVAIKILPEHIAKSEELGARFEREARAVASLNHPHICTLYDIGNQDGAGYMVMEYLEGETLAKRLERGPLPVCEALKLGVQIAAGLDAAHRSTITHRDLKPANIMLTRAGPKLLDFGLAKLGQKPVSAPNPSEVATLTQSLTVKGTIMGTFQYMAPEQLEGAEADARTDVFAFGAVLYEMIAGRKAFQSKSNATLISAIVSSDPPAVSTIQPSTPAALERVIQRCLAKDPDERWQTTRDLYRELEWIALGGSQVVAPAPVVKHRPFVWLLLVTALSLLSTVAVSWQYFHERPSRPPVARFTTPLTSNPLYMQGPLLSPDGSKALFWLSTGTSWKIFTYTLATREYRPIPNTDRTILATWSPDSRYIAALNPSFGELRKVEIAGGAMSVLAKTKGQWALTWSPRGVVLFSNDDGSLHRISTEGGASQEVMSMAANERLVAVQFLPDGEQFLFSVQTAGAVETRVGSLRGRNAKPILQANSRALYAEDQLLFVRDGALLAQTFDARKLELSGVPSTISTNVTAAARRLTSASGNGVLMFHSAIVPTGQRMTWFDRAGRKLSTVGEVAFYTNPSLSPDGKRLAVAVGDPVQRKRDIWIFDLIRGGRYPLTSDPADDTNPIWSPDGQYIAFASDRKGTRDLYRKLASGNGEEELLLENSIDKGSESWSPDGREIWMYAQTPGMFPDIYRFTLADHKFEKYIATPAPESQPQLSPDGRWLAYYSFESGRPEVYIQPYPATGERIQASTAGGSEPQWRGDGRELFFLVENALTAVDIKPSGKSIEIGKPHTLFETRVAPLNIRNRYVAAADGQKFMVLFQEEQYTGATGFETIMNWRGLLNAK